MQGNCLFLDPKNRHLKIASNEISLSKKRTGNPLQYKVNLDHATEIPDVKDYMLRRGILENGEVSFRDLLSVLVSDLNFGRKRV